MKHPAEMVIHQYLDKASSGETTISTSTVNQICKDVRDAVARPSIDTFYQVTFSFGKYQTWLEGSIPNKR